MPLPRHSDLSGNASSPLDWGFIGTGQLSMAILSDFLGDDSRAKTMCDSFDRKVIAELPHRSWTLTGEEVNDALETVIAMQDAAGVREIDAPSARYGDMAVKSSGTTSARAAKSGSQDAVMNNQSLEERATDRKANVVTEAAGEMLDAANHVAAAAIAVGRAAHQVARGGDRPADEAMSTANRAADEQAAATNLAVDEATALARSAMAEADRIVSKLVPLKAQ